MVWQSLFLAAVVLASPAVAEPATISTSVHDCFHGCELPNFAEHVIFEGTVSKKKTQDPRVLGGHQDLINSSSVAYRIVKFDYWLDRSEIGVDESYESDLGFTILPPGELTALNSGEELMITHQYDAKAAPKDERSITIPAGGLSFPSGYKLAVGSVSGLFSPHGVQEIDPSRLADGQLMALHFRVELIRSDKATAPAVESYRSPYRDRSYVADANHKYAPFTDFINNSGKDVNVYGTTLFLSNLTSRERSGHTIEIRINDRVVKTIETPDHIPDSTSDKLPMFIPYDLTLKPNDRISVRAKVSTPKALVFDFAAFTLADPGLEPFVERRKVVSADLNNDGFEDIVDIDSAGSIWVSLRVGRGMQDTQDAWVNGLGKIDTLEQWKAGDGKIAGLIARNADGLCLRLKSRLNTTDFLPGYCNQEIGDLSQNEVWGDFNGDGWPDRVKIDVKANQYMVSLGSKTGLGQPVSWINGFGGVTQLFAYDGNEDDKTDLLTEWSDNTGFRCMVWQSNGHEFVGQPCAPFVETSAAQPTFSERISIHAEALLRSVYEAFN